MSKMNVLLITSDQQHWDTLGVTNPAIKTPNLDRLAGEGIRFTRAYCVNPTCTPTRASILTGKYPSQHGAWSLGTKLPESEETVSEIFDKAGYETCLVGKAHFQQLKSTEEYPSLESNPLQQDLEFWKNHKEPFYGFKDYELCRNHADEAHVGQHYALWLEEKGLKDWKKYFQKPVGPWGIKEQQHSWNLPEQYHYNEFITERTNGYMEKYSSEDKPFFMWASFPDPHPPYLVPDPWAGMYKAENMTVGKMKPDEHDKNPPHFQLTREKNPDYSDWEEKDGNSLHGFHSHLCDDETMKKNIASYYGMVSYTDHCVGKILDKLDELGQTENTLIVFTTDHGHFIGQHGLNSKGAFHYEDMLKVPFIAKSADFPEKGLVSDHLVSLVDLAPTFLDFCNLPVPRTMTGLSLREDWCTGKALRDKVLIENHHNPTTLYAKTFIDERFKITVYMNREYGELFDLENDPGEFNNLWNEQSVRELKSHLLLKMLHADMAKEPMWMPRVSGA